MIDCEEACTDFPLCAIWSCKENLKTNKSREPHLDLTVTHFTHLDLTVEMCEMEVTCSRNKSLTVYNCEPYSY